MTRAFAVPLQMLCLLLLPLHKAATQSALADSAKQLAQRGDSSYRLGSPAGYRAAMSLWRRAAEAYRRLGDVAGEAALQRLLGNVFKDQLGELDSAIAHQRRALELWQSVDNRFETGRALFNLGNLYFQTGNWDPGLDHVQRARALAKQSGFVEMEAYAFGSLGYMHSQRGNTAEALANFREALRLIRLVGNPSSEGWDLTHLAGLFSSAGEFDSALDYLSTARALQQSVDDRAALASTLSDLAYVFSMLGRPDSANVLLNTALRLADSSSAVSAKAWILMNLGFEALLLDHADSAVAFLRAAIAFDRSVNDRTAESISHEGLGMVYLKAGLPDSAVLSFRRSIVLSQALQGVSGGGSALGDLGDAFAALKMPDSALAYYKESIKRVRESVGRLQGVELQRLAEWHQHAAKPDLRTALAYYDSAAAVRSSGSRRTGGEPNRLSFFEQGIDLFEKWSLAWLAGVPGRGERATTVAALAASERGRAQALLDLMRDTSRTTGPGADLEDEGNRLIEVLHRRNSAGLIYELTSDTLITWAVGAAGDVAVFRAPIRRDTLTALVRRSRASLQIDQTVDLVALRGSPLEPAVEESADRTIRTRVWEDDLAQLARVLLPTSFLARLKPNSEVVIVPQGTLALVPFAALPVGTTAEPFGALAAIRYAPSLATLAQAEARPAITNGPTRSSVLSNSLVVGNPAMPMVRLATGEKARLPDLRGAEAESRSVAARLGTVALIGPAATESAVHRLLPSAPVIHIASHGFAYSVEARARSSFLALAPDSSNDGLLTVAELLSDSEPRLVADLVVLSACQTGLGNLKQAEGTIGLQRAFLAKGARSVLVSLWSISDEVTRRLMDGFYRHWLDDPDHPSKAEALRRSQEEIRRTPGSEHPRYWAGFQLVGGN